jgi:hypothetical protein
VRLRLPDEFEVAVIGEQVQILLTHPAGEIAHARGGVVRGEQIGGVGIDSRNGSAKVSERRLTTKR